MAGTERLHRPMDPPRPAGGRSGGVGAGDSPVRWDDDDDDCGGGRVEGLAGLHIFDQEADESPAKNDMSNSLDTKCIPVANGFSNETTETSVETEPGKGLNPLHEHTGIWVPVSVPPMTAQAREEWHRGFGSNGGYFPEEEFSWELDEASPIRNHLEPLVMLCYAPMAVAPSLSWLSLFSSLWMAWAWSVPVMLATAAADRQGGELCSPTLCGGVNISFPFGIVTETSCGVRGFQVRCSNNIPYFGSSLYSSRILDIFYDNASLLVADVHKLQDFNASASSKPCHSPTNNSSSKVVSPFSISPVNQNMIFYDCAVPPAQAVRQSGGLVDTACGNKTLVGITKGPDVSDTYFLEGCSATVVPMLARPGEVNPANYKEFISGGFLLTWSLPPSPPSPAGGNSTRNWIIGIVCGVGGASLLAACFFFVWHKRKRRKQARAPNGFMRSESSMQSYSKDLELGGAPHIFTYEELEEATDGFSDSRELGDGGFGTVYKGKLWDGRVVAVKRLYKNNYKRVEQFINEVDILSRLLHQNLVILYGCTSRSSRDLMLVYEFIPNGTVADHLHGSRASECGLTWPLRMNIAIETAEALAYLHTVEIIHRDVKTNNILLDNSFHVKVADFGLSRLCPPEVTHVSTVPQGTPGYVDPVYHQCYKLTEKSDVYSFGVVLVELISSKPAVDMSRSHSDINLANMALNRIQNHEVDQLVDPELGYETDEETKKSIDLVAELAFQCLQLERDSRPSMKEIVEALNCIKNGDSPENKMDKSSPSPKEDAHLLTNSIQYSPDSVIHRFHSQSTMQSVASNASG